MGDIDYIKQGEMNEDLLDFARAWKAGYTHPVHPTVGRRLNACLVQAGEDPVPFKRATDDSMPSLVELLFREHTCADDTPNRAATFTGQPVLAQNERECA